MKQRVSTKAAPAAIGPYSQAIRAGHHLFLSGQIALDPATGQLVGETAAEQTGQVMKNLAAVLAAAGATFDDLVKTTIFLADLNDFTAVNEVYGAVFSGVPPARATVEVSRLPRDARVEIEGIAVLADA
jgi:2-iminobutanoate/2-iminopropanoate deaminase